MNRHGWIIGFLCSALATLAAVSSASAASGLNVVFGSGGISRLSYNGIVLFDESVPPADSFRIVDYTLSAGGKVVHVQDDPRHSDAWNAQTRTLTRTFSWGTAAIQYAVQSSAVAMTITVANTSSSTTISGLNIFPLEVRFPMLPKDVPSGVHYGWGEPGVVVADYGSAAAAFVEEDAASPLYYGLLNDNNTAKFKNLTAWIGTQRLPWGGGLPDLHKTIAPGATEIFHASLRFGPSGSTPKTLAPDVLAAYAAALPLSVNWPDRRPIGMLFIAANGPKSNSATNPPGWLNNPRLNLLTDEGKADFAKQLVAYAEHCIPIFRAMNAQGMITWDVEGEQYPTSYIGDPRVAARISPELNYNRAIDKYFETFRLAGLRVGVTIRPQKLIFKDAMPVDQLDIADADETFNLLADKIDYAREHWGCSIFYVDSTGGGEDPSIFARVHQRFPDVLLIPENPNVGMYSACAPFGSIRQNRMETPDLVRQVYPNAFSVIDTTIEKTPTREAELIDGVRHGDILMFHGAGPVSTLVQRAYREAAGR